MKNPSTKNGFQINNVELKALRKEGVSKNTSKVKGLFEKAVNLGNIHPKDRVLDLGCGVGLLGRILKEKKIRLYGLDNSKKALSKIKSSDNYFKLSCGSATKIPFRDNYFDVTFCLETLSLIPKWKKALDEIDRVTKKTIVLSIPNFFYWRIRHPFRKMEKEEECVTRNKLKKELIKRGYKIKEMYASSKFERLRGKTLCSVFIYTYQK